MCSLGTKVLNNFYVAKHYGKTGKRYHEDKNNVAADKETVMNVLLVGAAAMANNAAAPDKQNFGRWAIQSRHILLFNKHH